jgi:hypothetical protein
MLPEPNVWFVEPHRPDQIVDAVLGVSQGNPDNLGKLRGHYLAHFTREQHLATFAAVLLNLTPTKVSR